ncbi:MAG TPA: hypothetical protein DCZ72_05695 [Armatimonadetes bacterium]|nr:hypothetical protein [Armatimonadota bacterium]
MVAAQMAGHAKQPARDRLAQLPKPAGQPPAAGLVAQSAPLPPDGDHLPVDRTKRQRRVVPPGGVALGPDSVPAEARNPVQPCAVGQHNQHDRTQHRRTVERRQLHRVAGAQQR